MTNLASMWTVASTVLAAVAEWEVTPWAAADTGAVADRARGLAKALAGVPKGARGFGAFK